MNNRPRKKLKLSTASVDTGNDCVIELAPFTDCLEPLKVCSDFSAIDFAVDTRRSEDNDFDESVTVGLNDVISVFLIGVVDSAVGVSDEALEPKGRSFLLEVSKRRFPDPSSAKPVLRTLAASASFVLVSRELRVSPE